MIPLLSDESTTSNHVLIKVFLKSDFTLGYVTVGIRAEPPMKGVSLLLVNYLAGDKVMINPCVPSYPCSPDDTDGEM